MEVFFKLSLLVSKNEDLLKVMDAADKFLKSEKIVPDSPRYQVVNTEPKKSTNDLINFDESSTIEPVQNVAQNNAANELLDIFSAPQTHTAPISPQVTTNDLLGDINGLNLNQGQQTQTQGFQTHQNLAQVMQQPGYEYPMQSQPLNNYPVQHMPPAGHYQDSGFQSQVQTFDGWMQNNTFSRQENPQYTHRDSPI